MSEVITTPLPTTNYRYQIMIIGAFFFIFGFITWANGILIPYLKIACDLQHEWQAYLVTFAFYVSYTVMALPCGLILRKTGMVKGMQIGLIVMATGCLLFIPAAQSRKYELFLFGLFVTGAGLTILQTAVNPYITILGPSERAAQRISIMGICNKVAGALAPIILGAVILKNAGGLEAELNLLSSAARNTRLVDLAGKVILPYSILAAVLITVSFFIRFAHLPEIKGEQSNSAYKESAKSDSIWKYSPLMLGFVAVFCAAAVEVVAGDTIGRYAQYQNFSLDVAKNFTALTLISMIVGYSIGVFAIPKYISQGKAFLNFNLLGVLFTLLVIVMPGKSSVFFLAFLGFANALLWPAIWPAALKGLPNKLLNIGSAILIMGILGGAVLPLLYAWLADLQNKQSAYWLLLPCYLFNIYYWSRSMRARS